MPKARLANAMIYAALACGGAVILFPFIWMVSTSLKPSTELYMLPSKWLPSVYRWQNYQDAWQSAPFLRYLFNSMIVTVLVTCGELLTSSLAAFAFARLHFFGKNLIFSLLIATMMVPGELLLIPNYVTITQLGWIDRYEALIIPWVAGVPAIYFLREYFQDCPQEYYAAAKLDRASDLAYLWYIQLPLAKPALVTLGLLKMIASWNSFIWPLLVTNTEEMRTVQIGLLAFSTENGTMYELLMAASCILAGPVLIVCLSLEKYIVQAITHGGMKG